MSSLLVMTHTLLISLYPSILLMALKCHTKSCTTCLTSYYGFSYVLMSWEWMHTHSCCFNNFNYTNKCSLNKSPNIWLVNKPAYIVCTWLLLYFFLDVHFNTIQYIYTKLVYFQNKKYKVVIQTLSKGSCNLQLISVIPKGVWFTKLCVSVCFCVNL